MIRIRLFFFNSSTNLQKIFYKVIITLRIAKNISENISF